MKRRNKIYLALNHYLTRQHRAALAAIPLLMSPLAAQAEETTQKWSCDTDSNGGWQCVQKSVSGKSYARPYHAESSQAPDDQGPDVKASRNLDWVDEQYLTDEQKAQLAPGCCGAYIEPKRDYPDSDKKPDEAPLRLAASTTEVMADEIAKLEGGVQITQGYRQIRGDRAMVDQQNRQAEISGNVQLREPGVLLIGESAQVNLDTTESVLKNSTFILHEQGVRGTAEKMQRTENGMFYIENATYTTCEPTSNAWQLAANKVNLNTTAGVGTARDIIIKVKGVPVMYLPWMRFPIEDQRTSGLLFPHLEFSDDNGFDYGQPIYLNLAPNYDATITPRYIQERGAALELEGRHLSSLTETVIGGSFLGDDKGGDDADDLVKKYEGDDRWVARALHRGGFGENWRTLIDYTDVSDVDYFRDLDTATLQVNSQTHLRQEAQIGYLWNNWDFSVSTLEFENLSSNTDNDDYQIRPRVEANGYYRMGDWLATLDNEYASFDHDQQQRVTGDRIHLDYQLSWDKSWSWGYFLPSAGSHYIGYDLDNTAAAANDSPSATIPVVSIDTGIYLERETQWIGNFIQTLEPRLYALYVDFEDQSELPEFDTTEQTFSYNQLFRDNRFIGGDRVGDAQQITLGLTSRLIDPESGRETLRASIAQAYFLDDRQVFLPNTPQQIIDERSALDQSFIAGELAFYLGKNWRFNSDILFNENSGELDKGSVYLKYRGENRSIFNVGYRYTRNSARQINNNTQLDGDIEQGDVSTYLPVFGNWNLIARWNYDFTNNRELETFAGLEYNNCCWRVSLLARKWIDSQDINGIPAQDLEEDSGIFLQVQLKGLGGTGKRVDSILSDGIIGYEENR